LDLPSYVITYARNLPFLIINLLAAVPTFIAYAVVLVYFITRFITFESCSVCSTQFLEVQDIEEEYVKKLIQSRRYERNKKVWDIFENIFKIARLRLDSGKRAKLLVRLNLVVPHCQGMENKIG
jgi:hypothetical protein